MPTIEETLKERGDRYGKFKDHAHVSQSIKCAMKDSNNWHKLSDDKKEALEMVAHKIGRILNGDPDYDDNWLDMEGYSHLVHQELNKKVSDHE